MVFIFALVLVGLLIFGEIKIKHPAFRISIAMVACFLWFFSGLEVGHEIGKVMTRNYVSEDVEDALNTLELRSNSGDANLRELIKVMHERLPEALLSQDKTAEFLRSPEMVGANREFVAP